MISLISIPSLLKSSNYDVGGVNAKERARKYEINPAPLRCADSNPSDTSLNNDEVYYPPSSPEGLSPVESLLNPRPGASTSPNTGAVAQAVSPVNSKNTSPDVSLNIAEHYAGEKKHESKCVMCPACGMYFSYPQFW